MGTPVVRFSFSGEGEFTIRSDTKKNKPKTTLPLPNDSAIKFYPNTEKFYFQGETQGLVTLLNIINNHCNIKKQTSLEHHNELPTYATKPPFRIKKLNKILS